MKKNGGIIAILVIGTALVGAHGGIVLTDQPPMQMSAVMTWVRLQNAVAGVRNGCSHLVRSRARS